MTLLTWRGGLPVLDWTRVATRWLPFADAASADFPLQRLVRLALFQVSVGMATALLVGTLNRVMIVELGVGAWLVALMVALPVLIAPARALIGFKSDQHRSALGWRRVPYIWFGTLMQFGGLAILPFSLVLLTGETSLQLIAGHAAAALAFLLVGAGLQTTQTAGLALAADLATESTRPRVVALLYVMLLLGMVGAGLVFGALLADYSHTRLVQVVQGAAVASVLLNGIALWKQEARDPQRAAQRRSNSQRKPFSVHWKRFSGLPQVRRYLLAVGLGSAAFNMQDIILEPYGAEVLGLGVGATSQLTALMAGGALAAFALAARQLKRGESPLRLAGAGCVIGLFGFAGVMLAHPTESVNLFRTGAAFIGFGGGLFAVGTLSAAMAIELGGQHGLVLGAWGAVQATCTGAAIAAGGALRDGLSGLAQSEWLGDTLMHPATGYALVYLIELLMLFATLVVLGPLTRRPRPAATPLSNRPLGLADMPN